MKKHIVNKKEGKINYEIFFYLDDPTKKNKKEFVSTIIKKVPFYEDIGYAGYKSKDGLKKFLLWSVFGHKQTVKWKGAKKDELKREIEKTLSKFRSFLKDEIYIFIFPTVDNFIIKRMNGIGGFCPWKNTILININLVNGWKTALRNAIGHEVAHAISPYYWRSTTLGDWLVIEGIAEHFQEHFLCKGKSKIVKSITKKKAISIFNKIKPHLNDKNKALHKELFYGTGKYPLWTGYTIGYYIVADYLKKQENVNWNKIIKTSPKVILEKSSSIL